MELRAAVPADVPALDALERACFSEPWPAEILARRCGDITVAVEDGVIVGYLALSSILDEGSIDNVAAAPGNRRRGIGNALVADAVRRSRGSGYSVVYLEVRASNEAAIRLYEKHGFAPVGRRKNYYTKPREDAILMTLVL